MGNAAVVGCHGSQTTRVKAAPPTPKSSYSARVTGSTITFTDPHTGKLMWTATASSVDASTGPGAASVVGTMHGVNGVFYQNGIAADKIAAPTVTADQAKKTVTAVGGVTMQSIGPSPTTVRCDRLTWFTGSNKVVGTGHVVVRRGGNTLTGQSFQADTLLRTWVMPAP